MKKSFGVVLVLLVLLSGTFNSFAVAYSLEKSSAQLEESRRSIEDSDDADSSLEQIEESDIEASQENNQLQEENIKLSYSILRGDDWQLADNSTAEKEVDKSKIDGLKFDFESNNLKGNLILNTYSAKEGWSSDLKDSEEHIFKDTKLEVIKLQLTDQLSEKYDIEYRVFVDGKGWLAWTGNGNKAGTEGYDLEIQDLEVKLSPKEETDKEYSKDAFLEKKSEETSSQSTSESSVGEEKVTSKEKQLDSKKAYTTSQEKKSDEVVDEKAEISYQTHIQNIGWQDFVSNGKVSGTSGKSLRLEAIKINLKLPEDMTGEIDYQTHIQDIGWQNFVSNGQMSGTSGKSKRLEAIKINLKKQVALEYDVYYRVHIEDKGWLNWTKNGEAAGSQGASKRLEAIQIQLVKKGEEAPSGSGKAFLVGNEAKRPDEIKPNINYQTHVQNIGWQNYVKNGAVAGTSGRSLRLEGIRINLSDKALKGGVEYSTHIQNVGWQKFASNNGLSGTTGRSLRLEGIKIRLTGDVAKYYDVYYRVHIQDKGWLNWAKNGASAGSQGVSKRLEAIQIQVVKKGAKAPGGNGKSFVTATDFVSPKILKVFNANGNIMSAGYMDLNSNVKTVKNGNTLVTAASTYKLFIARYVMHLIDTGRLSWNSNYNGSTIRNGFYSMIVYSDNDFPQWIIARYGRVSIDSYLKKQGYKGIFNHSDRATTCTNDLLSVLSYYYKNSKNANVNYLLSIMKVQVFRDGIPRGSNNVVANKVGFLWDIRNDAGIVYDKNPYILVVLTKGQYDFRLVADTSKKVHRSR